ncbi:MAG: UDP-N-acetylglucosamine 2-epimerase, partial [Chthoniobacterales bacterium]
KPTEPFFLVIQHPSPSVSKGNERREMVELLEGVLSTGCRVLCSYPNADPGNVDIREAIDAAKSKYPHLTVYHNLPREEFVALYQNCSGIIGNSSSLIIESTFLKKPAILVGPRQDLRERAVNVLRVDFQRKEIAGACKKALSNTRFLQSVKKVKSLYGDGKSAPRVAKILSSCKLDRSLILKTMPY